MVQSDASSVSEYIADLPADRRRAIEAVRDVIRDFIALYERSRPKAKQK